MTNIGNYQILKKIGEGSFGRIYQAKHLALETFACLKQNIKKSNEHAQMLKREAKLLWKLDEHHSIPSIKDFFYLDSESAVMVTSFIEGETLDDIVLKNGPFGAEDSCWITERLLGALYYAHCNGVIHSDVKPENVFIEERKHDIKLIDFGLATTNPDFSTIPYGYTPKYAAPELLLNRTPIPETDIYGAGIVMLKALGGNIDNKTFKNNTPGQIKDFCLNLLKEDPRERPNWENNNPIETLSDLREKVFGRRHSEMITNLKGGGS